MDLRGTFIAFEGIDGSGKSTQLELLTNWARSHGHDPVVVREPGGTVIGERVRELLLGDAGGAALAPTTEALLFAAARAQLVAEVIEPALAAGRFVVADRFVGSSLAYQGAARGLGEPAVLAINELAIAGCMPTATLLLQLPNDAARARRSIASNDRIEAESSAFFNRVEEAYERLAREHSDTWYVIDASGDRAAIHTAICAVVAPLLARQSSEAHAAHEARA